LELTAAEASDMKHDDTYAVSVKKTLDLIAIATSAMKGDAMRIKADDATLNKTDCVHHAYEVCSLFIV
jgi:hypothetical protein